MKKNFGFFAAVLVIAAGCAKEIAPSLNDQVTVLTAGVEATKTVLDGNKVYWTAGDRISVNGVASEALAIDSPSATADFTFVGTLNAPYKAVFPASIYKDANTVVMPSVQEYAEKSFHSQASPMIAYSTAGNLSFSHPFSVVCLSINLKEDADKISYVEFSGNDGEQVCGDFTVDYDAKTLTGTGADSGNKSVRVNVGKALSADGPVLVHIVVPAIRYSKGFSVKIADENGHFMKKSVTAERDYKAGKVYDMTAFDFEPTDTELNVDIASASDLIAFANKWNDGEYTSSEDSPLVVNLTQDIAFSEADNAAWPGIGTTSETAFTGQFNGNEKSISGFTSSTSLFPYIGSDGKVSDLTLAGEVTYDLTGCAADTNVGPFATSTKGILVGCISDVDVTLTSTAKVAQKFRAGGVAGYMNGGSMTDCAYTGVFELSEDMSCNQETRIGGIVGFLNASSAHLDGCYMAGSLLFNATATGASYWGGIVGNTVAQIKECYTDATASISVKNATKLRFGGIVGHTGGTAAITDCTNNADVTVDCSSFASGSYTELGGVVGRNGTDVEVKAINNGIITLAAGGLRHDVGGIVGYNYGGIVTASTNYGAVKSADGYKVGILEGKDTTAIAYMGGCVGRSTSNISSCTNNGKVSISDTDKHSDKAPGRGLLMGGIVGYFSGIELSDCTNNATVYNGYYDNDTDIAKAPATGGVVGYLVGKSEARIQVTNCTSNSVESSYVSGKRGWVGGICGYAQYVDFNRVKNYSPLKGTGYYYGGLSGQLNNSTMTDSDAEAAMSSIANNTLIYAGGIAGSCSNTVNVSNTSFKGDISSTYASSKKGAFSGYTTGTSVVTISNCKFSGTIDDTAVTAETLDDLSIGSIKSGAKVTLTDNTVF